MAPSIKAYWFLPLKKIRSRYRSDTAHGEIDNLALELTSITLSTRLDEGDAPAPVRQEPAPHYLVPCEVVAASDFTAALNGLVRNIEALHGTLKLLGWLAVGALAILAFK